MASITLTYPNGSEILIGGQSCTITWSSSDLTTGKIRIYAKYLDNGDWNLIVDNLDLNATSYNWTLPTNVSSNQCKIRVGNYDTGTGDWIVYDDSNNLFTIFNNVITLRPTSDGDSKECSIYPTSPTTHYDKVDEATSDSDSTYIYASSMLDIISKLDLFNKPDITGNLKISQVKVYAKAKKQSGTTATYQVCLSIKIGGTVYNSSFSTTTTSYANYSNVWTTNPYTGNPWNWEDINNLQIGATIKVGGNSEVVQRVHITQIWAEVTTNIEITSTKNLNFSVLKSYTSTKNLNFSVLKSYTSTKNFSFSLEQEIVNKPPKILINNIEANEDIKEITFNDTKDGFSNTCKITTRNLKEMPIWLHNGRNEVCIKYSQKSILFYGYFDYYENKERKPVGDIYSFEGYNWLNSFKDIYITDRYNDQKAEDILINLIQKYAPEYNLSYVDATNLTISLVYNQQPLFQAIQDLCYITQYNFWITEGKNVYFENLGNRPALLTEITDLNYNAGHTKIDYDLSNIKNTIKIKGGMKLSDIQLWQHTVVASDTNIFKIYPEKIYNIMVYVNDNIMTIGQTGKDDDNASIQVLFDTQKLEFKFKTRPANGDVIKIYYQYAYGFQYQMRDLESISIWGKRDAGTIEVPNIIDIDTAKNYAQTYLTQYAYPKLTGQIEVDMKTYPEVIHAGDIVPINFERFYEGNLYIDEAEYYINNVKFRATLKLRKQKDLFTILKNAFDLINSMQQRIRALEQQDTSLTRDVNYQDTITYNENCQKVKSSAHIRFTDDLTIGLFEVEDDNYVY
ncbi:MAG: hypothetical protein GYA14_14090 [Ignavibacteria bacterium]|nr:hypothetical protein [Ignavibacteria bacterium]